MHGSGSSDGEPTSPKSHERRQLTRNPGGTIHEVFLVAGKTTVSAVVHDISIEGIGLVVEHAFDAETMLLLTPSKARDHQLAARVRHATPLPKNKWLLGCSFTRRLVTDDILSLG